MVLLAGNGILEPIMWLLGKLLNFIFNCFAQFGIENIGLCIIVFTIITKIAIFPLTFKQQKSSKINAYIQPEISKIQKKYKNKQDQESMMKQNAEIQALYKEYGTSMTGGCLGTFIQLPIIYALYRVIYNIPVYIDSIRDLYTPIASEIMTNDAYGEALTSFVSDNRITLANKAVKVFTEGATITVNNVIEVINKFSTTQWHVLLGISSDSKVEVGTLGEMVKSSADVIINNVDKITDLNMLFGINMTEAPGFKLSVALLVPISAALFQFLSSLTMKMPSTDDNNPAAGMMKNMMFVMPLMSFFMCISMPAGVGLYWTVSAFISFMIQICVNYYYGHVDMEKIIAKNKIKAAKKNKKNKGKKGFMERMQDMYMSQAEGTSGETSQSGAINRTASNSYRNYSSPSSNVTKKGSILDKANLVRNYNANSEDEGGKK